MVHHEEQLTGAQDIFGTSDDELQNASAKEDDSITNADEEPLASQNNGTPVKKSAKRKDASEVGSAKKKMKQIGITI